MINNKIKGSGISNQYDETEIRDSEIEKNIEISEEYEEYSRRNLNKITNLLGNARKEIIILGLVGYGPIHESPNEIINLINDFNGSVKILIGNPRSKYFKNRMQRENDEQKSSLHQYKAALAEIEKIYYQLSNENRSNLIIREYNNLNEDLSLQIIDRQEMYVNIRKNIDGLRCFDSPMFKVYRKRLAQQFTFNYYLNFFEVVWNKSSTKVVGPETKKWISVCKNGKHEKIPKKEYS